MHDIERAIADAWIKLRPRLERDPAELRRRLNRRHNKLINQPPRAWCIALRASDTRLASFSVPRSAFRVPHSLRLTSDNLKFLSRPVYLDPPGESLSDVMKKLGLATPASLLNARLAGVFRTHYIEGLGGRWGKPHPLLYTDQPLDPSARLFATGDPAWAATARHLPGRIPPSITATLERVPYYRSTIPAGRYDDTAGLHPEHPHVDRPYQYKSKSKKLLPPPPDYVAYKWKGDEYLGYDWRAAERNPKIRSNYIREQYRLLQARQAAQRRRRERGSPGKSQGSLQFAGYRWRCPCCCRLVNILYHPLPRVHLLPDKLPALAKRALKHKPSPSIVNHSSSITRHCDPPLRPRGFACIHCHKVKYTRGCAKFAWGEIVAYLSAGLLYGNEVKRPEWFKPQRKHQYKPRLNRAPSRRRPQIEKLLLTALKTSEVARQLGLSRATIRSYANAIFQQHGVQTLTDLLRKHGHVIPPPVLPEIRRRVLAGQTNHQIAQELGVNTTMITNQRQRLRKQGHKLPDGRRHNRPGGRQRVSV